MSHDALLGEYLRVRPELEDLARAAEQAVRSLSNEHRVMVHFVSSRVKSEQSLRRKLARPEKTYQALWDVTDLVGVRVSTYFEDTMVEVAKLIEASFAVDFRHSVDKQRARNPLVFGYRSLHYVCALPELAPHPDFRFELQVRTALQHAWAEVEHDLGYKADAVPPAIRRRFSRIASLLEIADAEFVSIRRELEDYQETARRQVAQGDGRLPLDEVSLTALVRTPAVLELDTVAGRVLGRPVSEQAYYPGYLLRCLTLAGLGTAQAVREAIGRLGGDVERAVTRYFEVSQRTWGFSRDSVSQVEAGYSLFFLAHLAVLGEAELELTRVAKLAALYQQLDELEERPAQELATLLARALMR